MDRMEAQNGLMQHKAYAKHSQTGDQNQGKSRGYD
jgi:hypothetical protein